MVFFQDECRFGQQGTLTRVWARRGSRPTAVRQTEYDYLWVIAAASPQTGQAEAILSPCLNTSIINQFLQQFSRALPANVHAAMIWDGAGFHRAHDLKTPDNITLISLPPVRQAKLDVSQQLKGTVHGNWFVRHVANRASWDGAQDEASRSKDVSRNAQA